MISSIISRNSSRLVFFLRKLYSMSVNVSCFILLAPPLFCWYYYTILRTWTGVGNIQRFLRNRELERENVELREANIILNDAISCFVKVKKVKTWKWHLWLFMNKGKYTVKGICLVFKTNELGYYQWLINWSESSARELLSVKMQEIQDEHPILTTKIMFKSHDTSFIPKGIHVCYQIVYSAMVDIVILRKRIKRNTGQLRSQRRYSTTMASCMERQCSTVLQQEDPFHRDRQQNKKKELAFVPSRRWNCSMERKNILEQSFIAIVTVRT